MIALLPFKKNSSRVPNKNFRLFNSRPLYSVMLDTLLSVDLIDFIIINTDAASLIAPQYKRNSRVVIRERDPSICGDDVSMNLIIADDLAHSTGNHYLMTHTTNPLLSRRTITSAILEYMQYKDRTLVSATECLGRYYFSNKHPVNHDPKILLPTQDLDPIYFENSLFYIFSKECFRSVLNRICGDYKFFVTPKTESIDIDDEEEYLIVHKD